MNDQTKHIEALIAKASAADRSEDALRFSQAACNAANAFCAATPAPSYRRTTVDKTETLKACPLCGIGKPVHKTNMTPAEWLECDHCGFTLGPWESTWNEIAAWNTCKSEALADELSEKVEGVIQWLEQMANCFKYTWPNTARHCRLHVDILRAALSTLTPSPAVDLLREAATAFVAKLDECQPYIDSAFFQMANNGMPHTGPQYGEELKALRAALKETK